MNAVETSAATVAEAVGQMIEVTCSAILFTHSTHTTQGGFIGCQACLLRSAQRLISIQAPPLDITISGLPAPGQRASFTAWVLRIESLRWSWGVP